MALRRAAKNVERLTMMRAQKLGLTPNMLRVVLVLHESPGLWSAEIGRRLGFDKRTVDYIMKGLADRGLITRSLGSDDAKRAEAWLTTKGTRAAEEGKRIHARIESAVAKIVNGDGTPFKVTLARIAKLEVKE